MIGLPNRDSGALAVPLLIWLVSRALLLAVVYVGLISGAPLESGSGKWRAFPDNPWLDGFARWDSGWYASIAEDGYAAPDTIKPGEQRNTVFFPLYPLTMRALAPLTGNPFLSGMIVSNISLLLALICLYRLVERYSDRGVATRTLILLAFHPHGIFLSAVYTESLFLLLVVASFYFAEENHWSIAGLLASLAGLTRVTGFITAISLCVMYVRKQRSPQALLHPQTLVLGLGFLGPLAHLGYLYARYGTPFAFVHGQAGWDLGRLWPITAIERQHWILILIAFALSLLALIRMPPEYGVWAGLTSLTSMTRWYSAGRYAMVIFPATIMAARLLRNRYAFALVMAIQLYYFVVYALDFSQWKWVG